MPSNSLLFIGPTGEEMTPEVSEERRADLQYLTHQVKSNTASYFTGSHDPIESADKSN